jgi:hypothetical protein
MDEALRRRLDQPVNPAIVSQRPGPGNKNVRYIEGNTLFLEASRLTAGFGGWSSRLLDVWFGFPPSTLALPALTRRARSESRHIVRPDGKHSVTTRASMEVQIGKITHDDVSVDTVRCARRPPRPPSDDGHRKPTPISAPPLKTAQSRPSQPRRFARSASLGRRSGSASTPQWRWTSVRPPGRHRHQLPCPRSAPGRRRHPKSPRRRLHRCCTPRPASRPGRHRAR